MIRIFGVNKGGTVEFTVNGDIVVQPSKAIIHKYENSDFYLEIEASIDYLDYFEEGRFIVADVPWLSSPYTAEIFRIGSVVTNHFKITAKCWHITYDLDWFIPNHHGYIPYGNVEFNAVLRLHYTDYHATGFGRKTAMTVPNVTCNAFIDNKTIISEQSVLSFIKAVVNSNGLFFNRERDKFWCTNARVETESNITLEYGKNIRNFQKTENWDNVTQQIRTFIDGWIQAADFQCPDAYAYYPPGYDKDTFIKYARFIEFKSRLNPDDYSSESAYYSAYVADIQAQVNDYFKEHGKPIINYTLNAYVDNVVDLGYQILVKDNQMGVELTTSVVGFKYNLLTESYDEIQFGNYKNSMKNYNYKVDKRINDLSNTVGGTIYPKGAIFTTTDSYTNPNTLDGFEGYWTLQSSSGGVYTWKRVS